MCRQTMQQVNSSVLHKKGFYMIAIGQKTYVHAVIIFLSTFLFISLAFGEKEEVIPIRDQILKLLNHRDYNHVKRGAMPIDYKYSFPDKCHFLVHSEWFGETHSDISDTLIPMASIKIEKEIEDGSYFLFVTCKDQDKCMKVQGENTGDPYQYMYVQSFIYAGKSEQSYQKIKGMFEKVISECSE